jgi:hypothetical protein
MSLETLLSKLRWMQSAKVVGPRGSQLSGNMMTTSGYLLQAQIVFGTMLLQLDLSIRQSCTIA